MKRHLASAAVGAALERGGKYAAMLLATRRGVKRKVGLSYS
jgi:hypothetical protein